MTGSTHAAHALYSPTVSDYHQDIGFLEVVVAVRAVGSPARGNAKDAKEMEVVPAQDYKVSCPEANPDPGTDVVTLSGFSSVEAASQAVQAIAEWCTRWGHKHGLITASHFPIDQPSCVDKSTSTEEHSEAGESAYVELPAKAPAENHFEGSLWCSSRSEGARGLLLHRDSFDLSNPTVRAMKRKEHRTDSKLWRFIHRGLEARTVVEEECEVEEDDPDVARWRTVSEARDTILLQNRAESKGTPQQSIRGMPWLPFTGFAIARNGIHKTDAIRVLPRGRSIGGGRGQAASHYSNRWDLQSRSFTPPKDRAGDGSCGKYHQFTNAADCAGKEKDNCQDISPRSFGPHSGDSRSAGGDVQADRANSRSNSAGAKPALLEILERASTARNSNISVCGYVEHGS